MSSTQFQWISPETSMDFHGFSWIFSYVPWIFPAFLPSFVAPKSTEEDAKVELLKLLGPHPHIREASCCFFSISAGRIFAMKIYEDMAISSGKLQYS
jgi:hypothetical protein